jgi:hypothetical protein
MTSGDDHEVHVIFDSFSWNLQPRFVPYFIISRPPFAFLGSSLHVYVFLYLFFVCFVPRALDSMFGLLFARYGILLEMCLPFVFLALGFFAPYLGP